MRIFRPVADTGGVGIVGINVHFQPEGVADPHLYVIEPGGGGGRSLHGDGVPVLDAESRSVRRAHVNMAVGDDAALRNGDDPLGSHDGEAGRSPATLPDSRTGGLTFSVKESVREISTWVLLRSGPSTRTFSMAAGRGR